MVPFNRHGVQVLFAQYGGDSWCSRQGVTIERRRRDAEAVRDLGDTDIGVGQQRLGDLNVTVGEFRRTPSFAAKATGGGETASGRSRIRLRSNSARAPNI
jgi:hypothetical protein